MRVLNVEVLFLWCDSLLPSLSQITLDPNKSEQINFSGNTNLIKKYPATSESCPRVSHVYTEARLSLVPKDASTVSLYSSHVFSCSCFS